MRQMFALAIGIVLTVVSTIIGVGITSTTYNTVNSTAPSTMLNTTFTNITSAMNTFTGFLPVIVIAGVGGIALYYLLFYLGRQQV